MANKRLVTEADVLALAPGSELVLDATTIVTPAALDAAHRRGLRVRRAGEGPTPVVAAPAGLERLLASDGTYVVVVRGGRASVTRLTENGPQAL